MLIFWPKGGFMQPCTNLRKQGTSDQALQHSTLVDYTSRVCRRPVALWCEPRGRTLLALAAKIWA